MGESALSGRTFEGGDVQPPEDVRAVMPDGSEIPLECVYVGFDGETHRWDAVVQLGQVPKTLRIGSLPAKTAVGVRCVRP